MADGEIGIRFRYFAMILFQTIMVFRRMSEPPSIQGHSPLVQAHNLSLDHLHDLLNESACWLSNHFVHGFASGRLSFVHVHTFTSCTPLTRSPNEQSDWKGDQAIGLELTSSRSAASLFLLPSGESLRCLVVVHDGFVNCCTLVIRGLIWFKWLSALQTSSVILTDTCLEGTMKTTVSTLYL